MTPEHKELRQFAAIILHGYLSNLKLNSKHSYENLVTESIECAQKLQAQLDELRPKQPHNTHEVSPGYSVCIGCEECKDGKGFAMFALEKCTKCGATR